MNPGESDAARAAASTNGTAYAIVARAPAPGPGNWAGASSATLDDEEGFVVAYRLRTTEQRGSAVVVAFAPDGEQPTPVARLEKERFGAESLERPALVRTETGRWRLYVSCATPGSKHWRIEALEASDPTGLDRAQARTVFAGDARTGVKDPVVRHTASGWHAWVCCHPLDDPGHEDRMVTRHATSNDGWTWQWRGVALQGRPGSWDARGARVTAVLPDGSATYDGRASRAENFSERTGTALPGGRPGILAARGGPPVSRARYLDVVPVPGPPGAYRVYYEAPLDDGSHELRTQLVAPGMP